MTILDDIKSGERGAKDVYYAKKGDKVTLVADYENVLIVEKNGNKFPVKKELVRQ